MLGGARQEETGQQATWEWETVWGVGSSPHEEAERQPGIQSRAQNQRKAGQWDQETKIEEPRRLEQYG